jgi:hypothetical protein
LNVRIGLIGAPESGKSKLARALGKKLDIPVVDNYVQRLQKKTALALGPWSSYSELIMVAGHRLAEEEKIGERRVTVGTMIDSLAYAAVHADVLIHRREDQNDRRSSYVSAQGAMQGLALMYKETWDYDISFLLPYSDAQKKKKSGTWEVALDAAYVSVIESFEVPFVYKVEGDHNSRLQIIEDTIDLIQNSGEAETPTTEEQGV